LVDELCARGVVAWALDGSDAIAATVAAEVRRGDVVVMMSNGAFGGLRQKLQAALS
jgi:UDP-N-acetylmuramate: L-alanyl-gamma-D-glutamyl-meso-diaminopimelate ligase